MALAEAILVCLTDRPMSGYDLAKTFDASIGFFWRASHQQVYREISCLRERGLVKSEEIEQSGKPNRIVHTLTKAGKKAIYNWSLKPTVVPSIKDDLLVKLYALDHVDISSLREQFEVRRDQTKARLASYHRIKERHFDGQALSHAQKGKLIALYLGIESEEQTIKTLEHAILQLQHIQD